MNIKFQRLILLATITTILFNTGCEETKAELRGENIQIQQVWADPLDDMGMPSPDGRFISYVNWNVPCLSIYDVNTSESKDIEGTKGSWGENWRYAESSIWSPDGQKLAYVWYGPQNLGKDSHGHGLISLRVVGIDASESEEIFSDIDVHYPHPYSWSQDGKYILASLCHHGNTHEIILISVADKTWKSVKKIGEGHFADMSLSPDGKYVAYTLTPDINLPQTDIFVINVKDGTEKVLIDHPETDFAPLWTPDGNNIIFFSNRTGSVSAWSQKVVNGKAVGEEKLIKNLNSLTPKIITSDGSLYMTFHEGDHNIFICTIDPKTGEIVSPPTRMIESNVGWNSGATFSHDGKYLAYISQRGVLNTEVTWGQQSLIIRDLNTGEEKQLTPKLSQLIGGRFGHPKWSPNQDEIVVKGRNKIGHNGAFIINLKDTLTTSLTGDKEYINRDIFWSNDPDKFYFYENGNGEIAGIYMIERTTQKISKIVDEKYIDELIINPISDKLTIVTDQAIKILDLNTNDLIELARLDSSLIHCNIAWSPDERWLYFTKCFGKRDMQFGRISSDGSIIRIIEESFPHLKFLSVHPDGKRIVFTIGDLGSNSSLWKMKNYLPD